MTKKEWSSETDSGMQRYNFKVSRCAMDRLSKLRNEKGVTRTCAFLELAEQVVNDAPANLDKPDLAMLDIYVSPAMPLGLWAKLRKVASRNGIRYSDIGQMVLSYKGAV